MYKRETFYIHRSGRTARAGLEGMAISFYDDEDIKLIELLEKKGIEFVYSDVRNGEWVQAKSWNKRTLRKKTVTNIEQEAWKQVRSEERRVGKERRARRSHG